MSDKMRCHYEVLSVTKESSQEEIRSAYKKLALQLHPDKQVSSGMPEETAKARFQELINAYDVLSDPQERAWYDANRYKILYADPNSRSGSSPNFISTESLFAYFSNSAYSGFSTTGKGFYKVYSDLFSKLYAQEVEFARTMGLGIGAVQEAPLLGDPESDYSQVSAFYGYWQGFCTVMDFSWVDEFEASTGPNRKARRMMEDENTKARKKAKREFNDAVRRVADFIKKRDKRVLEMQMKKRLEEEKKRAKEKERRMEEARVKLERARLYEDPEWAKVEEPVEEIEEWKNDEKEKNEDEFHCVVCSKKFKSEKQWINHEQSKKHKEKVAALKKSYKHENKSKGSKAFGDDNIEQNTDSVDDICAQFNGKIKINHAKSEAKGVSKDSSDRHYLDEETEIPETVASSHTNILNEETKINDDDDSSEVEDETIILEELISHYSNKIDEPESVMDLSPDMGNGSHQSMGGNNMVNGNKEKERISEKLHEAIFEDEAENAENRRFESKKVSDRSNAQTQETDGYSSDQLNTLLKRRLQKQQKTVNQSVGRRTSSQRDSKIKLKSAKGKKQKGLSRSSGHECETCGESFMSRFILLFPVKIVSAVARFVLSIWRLFKLQRADSNSSRSCDRNKLFRHLEETGHAMIKAQ